MADGPEITEFNAKDALAELHQAIDNKNTDMQKSIEAKFDKFDEDNAEKQSKFDALEKKNDELVEKAEAQGKSLDEVMQRAKDLELFKSTHVTGEQSFTQSTEYKNMTTFFKSGVDKDTHAQAVMEMKADSTLRTDINGAGGYTVPVLMSNELMREEEEVNPVRSIVRSKTIDGKTIEQPIRDEILVATFEGEFEENDKSISNYRNETITTWRQTVTVPSTQDMLMNSAFDIVSELTTDASEAFAIGLGNTVISGDGVKKPTGILGDTRVTGNARDTAAVDTIDLVDIRRMQGDLKLGYLNNARYIFNQSTLAFLRTLKGDNGQFIWQPAITEAAGPTIDGFGYTLMPNMSGPDESGAFVTGEFPVVFGSFMRGYCIYDRTGMSVIRDDVTQAGQAIVNWTFHRWLNGQVLIPEAMKALKVK